MAKTFLITIEEVDKANNKIKTQKKQLSQTIRDEVVKLLNENRVSLTDFGKGCNMSRQAAQQLLSGRTRLAAPSVKKILPALSSVGLDAESPAMAALVELLFDYDVLMG